MNATRIQTIGGSVVTIEVEGTKVLVLSGRSAARLAGAIDGVFHRGYEDRSVDLEDEAGNPWTAEVADYGVWLVSGASTPTPPKTPRNVVELDVELALVISRGIDRGCWSER